MPIKVVSDYLGRSFKMGRKRPIARGPRLSLKNYLVSPLPVPPESCDYTAKADKVLKQMLGNDRLGDCTAASAFHIAGTLLANAGDPVTWSTVQQVVPFYSATGGYIEGKESTDNGANEVTVLNYWQNFGLLPDGSHKIIAWVAVDARNQQEVATAIWLFENIYCGVECPDAWVNPIPAASLFKWDVAGGPNPDNGHAFPGLAYDAQGVTIATWGMTGTMTWPAVKRYCGFSDGGELYAVLSADMIERASAKAPNGLDVDQLKNNIRILQP